jgi:uncharacterized protein YndB with AHSA1/START domain
VPERAPDFVYVIYIAASVDKVWNGLIDRELTKAYWGHYNISDWKKGSRWEHVRCDGSGKVDIAGRVIEIDPPRRLVVTWAAARDAEDETRHSRVTYEITALGPDSRLTVTHRDLEAGSEMLRGITQGWPAVLSNLKTLLETGRTLSDQLWD